MSNGTSDLSVTIEPWGPAASGVDRAARAAMRTRAVRRAIGRARHRLLSTELIGADLDGRRAAAAPRAVRTTIYDYDEERALRVEAPLRDPASATVSIIAAQPPPSGEEFAAAVEVLNGTTRSWETRWPRAGSSRIGRCRRSSPASARTARPSA